jgi:hypothetical protein
MKRAIALSLSQIENPQAAAPPPASSAVAGPTLIVSDDEFDLLCSNDLSLKVRLSKSSLDSEEDNSVRIVAERVPSEESANVPGPSNIPVKMKNQVS